MILRRRDGLGLYWSQWSLKCCNERILWPLMCRREILNHYLSSLIFFFFHCEFGGGGGQQSFVRSFQPALSCPFETEATMRGERPWRYRGGIDTFLLRWNDNWDGKIWWPDVGGNAPVNFGSLHSFCRVSWFSWILVQLVLSLSVWAQSQRSFSPGCYVCPFSLCGDCNLSVCLYKMLGQPQPLCLQLFPPFS